MKKSLWIIATVVLAIASGTAGDVEPGFTVETLFDLGRHSANAFGLYPDSHKKYVLALDSAANRILKLSLPLSQNSSLEVFAGSPQGEAGYVDGPAAKSLFNRPQSLAIGDKGAVFVADTKNLAIRKIEDGKVTTIAGGSSRKPGYADGPGGLALFSNEFTLAYDCGSLLVADRGNRLIREIHVHSCVSSNPSVSGSQLRTLIPAVVLSICLGILLGALLMKMFSDRGGRRAMSMETVKACWESLTRTRTTTQSSGCRSEVARAMSGLLLLLWHQLFSSFSVGPGVSVKLAASQKEFPDLIDFTTTNAKSPPPGKNQQLDQASCLEQFLQEFANKHKQH